MSERDRDIFWRYVVLKEKREELDAIYGFKNRESVSKIGRRGIALIRDPSAEWLWEKHRDLLRSMNVDWGPPRYVADAGGRRSFHPVLRERRGELAPRGSKR